MVCFRVKRHVLNCFIFSDYDSLRDVRKNPDRFLILIKNNMKLTACMYILVISYVRKYSLCGFRKINTNLLYTLTILIICKEKKTWYKYSSIFITLTEINNKTHYVAKKIKTKQKTKQTKKKTKNKKQAKTAPIGFALSV
jgi:uncharacterized metal-binding protein